MVALHRCSDQKHPSTSKTNKNLGFRSQMSTQEFSWNIAPHFEASKYPLDNTRYMSRDMTPIYLPIRPVLNTNGNELLIDPSRKSLFYGGPFWFRKVFAWSQRRRLRLRHIGTYYVPIQHACMSPVLLTIHIVSYCIMLCRCVTSLEAATIPKGHRLHL